MADGLDLAGFDLVQTIVDSLQFIAVHRQKVIATGCLRDRLERLLVKLLFADGRWIPNRNGVNRDAAILATWRKATREPVTSSTGKTRVNPLP